MKPVNKPLEYTGVVVNVGDRQEFRSNRFAKREVILSADPRAEYPRFLQIVLTTSKLGDRTELISKKDLGKTAKITGYVETRKWESKTTGKVGYITEVSAFKVEWQGEEDENQSAAEADVDTEDLPF